MTDQIRPPKAARRLLQLHENAQAGITPWPPIEAVLVSLRDQHEHERRSWLEVFPDVAAEALFMVDLLTLQLWRRALDAGEAGQAQSELHTTMIEALRRLLG